MSTEDQTQSGVEQRLAALEQHLAQQQEQLDRQGRELGPLNLWQQGRVFSYIARLYPKTRSVIFLHNDFFGDNVKYAFLAFQRIAASQGVACHFFVNNPDQRALLMQAGLPTIPPLHEWTLEHMRLLMGTKVLVACDHFTPFLWNPPLPYFLMQGARFVQLWHGIPLKEIGLLYSDTPSKVFDGLRLSSTGPADVLVGPGIGMREQWRQWLAYREFAPLGYPRNDVLLREPMEGELINVDLAALDGLKSARTAGKKTILYTPTFRDNTGTAWLAKADLPAFAHWCESKGWFLLVKLHPAERGGFEDVRQRMPGVRFVKPDSDPYPLLRHADMLVTDYSSLALDYLLLDRPMVFYWPDIEDYRTQSRNLLPDHEFRIAGEKAMDAAALRLAVENALTGNDAAAARRRTLARAMFDYSDGNAGDRVARLILEQLDAPEQLPPGWGI